MSRNSCEARRRDRQSPCHNPRDQLKKSSKETAPYLEVKRNACVSVLSQRKGAMQTSDSVVIKIHLIIEVIVAVEMSIPKDIRLFFSLVLLQYDWTGSSRAGGRSRRRQGRP